MSDQALLIELGCEELPAGQLRQQSELFAHNIVEQLIAAGLVEKNTPTKTMATPRRLAVWIERVAKTQPAQVLERKGPAVEASFDQDGQPTQAALGFAKSVGLEIDQLDRLTTEQGQWLAATVEKPGLALTEVLADALAQVIKQMASAKSMRWMAGDERFLRPVRWLVVLHGSEVVPVSLFGLASGNISQGHRVHAPGPCLIANAGAYEQTLSKAHVCVDMAKRQSEIESQVQALAKQHQAVVDGSSFDALVEENTQLTEWPVAVLGEFDPDFLSVPQEALIGAMQHHQKCFPLRSANDQSLIAKFVAIANIESKNVEAMRRGFERVIRPRLADAQFFWDQDRKTPLAARRDGLDAVLFQKDLGSLGDKVRRMEHAAPKVATSLEVDAKIVGQVVALCKCDLLTEMVGEFPELQGVMGHHYAKDAGEGSDVAEAIEAHYWPRYSGDRLPNTALAASVGLLDRADTLLGVFGVGLKPKGSKDPFALRRNAMGLIRILETQPQITLTDLLEICVQPLAQQLDWDQAHQTNTIQEVEAFCLERWRSHVSDQGIQTATANAVLATAMGSIGDLSARAKAVAELQSHRAIDQLIASNKRLANLLSQAGQSVTADVDEQALIEAEEKTLYGEWKNKQTKIDAFIDQADYTHALAELAELAEPLDAFFESVMVMSDDQALKANRLALLNQMRQTFLRVGDLAQLGL